MNSCSINNHIYIIRYMFFIMADKYFGTLIS